VSARNLLVTLGLVLAVGACAKGPKYVRPEMPTPPTFKEADGWAPARPNDEVPRGAWWEILGDPVLNDLEARLVVSNNTLRAAEAQFAQARALVRGAQSARVPQVSGAAVVSTYDQSATRPRATQPTNYTDYLLRVDAWYEFDVWGRVRNTISAAQANAQASAADLESVRLSLSAELAANYVAVRALDAERAILLESVAAYEKALELTRSRYKGGVATAVDVAQAEALLESTRAQAIDVQVRRAQVEHAIAVLVGAPAASVTIPFAPLSGEPLVVPAGLPATLLERRPDVAAAERRVAAANAQVGVAAAAFFPTISLTANGGLESAALADLLRGVSGFWTIAPAAAAVLIDGGRRRAVSDQAKAGYERSVALYRETSLNALREVEDQLSTLRILEQETVVQRSALAAAERLLVLSTNRYKGGIATYLEVIVAQSAVLNNRRTAASILARRMTASVQLVKALGGGWQP
jgi:NodT family efflux transporter outer membrane factor (OMF) lipoprotein